MMRNVWVVLAVLVLAKCAGAAPLLVDLSFNNKSLDNYGTAGETAFLGDALTATGNGETPVYVDGVATYRNAAVESYALDLSSSSSMLTLGDLAVGAGGVKDALNGLQSFTITMWMKGDVIKDALPVYRRENSSAYAYNIEARTDQYARPRAVVNNTWSTPGDNGWMGYENKWFFMALTYDGTSSTNNVGIWRNDADSAVATLHGVTQTADVGAVNISNYPISFGMKCDVVIDNIKIYGSKTDNSGDLSTNDTLKWVYWGDMTAAEVPEPATITLLGIGAAAAFLRKRKA